MSPRAIVGLLAAVLIAALAGAAAVVWIGSETAGPQAAGEDYRADAGEAPLRYDTEYPTMHYATAPRSDAIA